MSALRAAMAPVNKAIAKSDLDGLVDAGSLSGTIAALFTVRKLVLDAPPFRISTCAEDHELARLWTDASEPGRADQDKGQAPQLGAILEVSGKWFYLQLRAPVELVRAVYAKRDKGINYFETFIVGAAFEKFGSALRNKKVLCFIDNTACVFALLKGTSNCMMLRMMAQRVHILAARLGILHCPRWIPTDFNPADGLTREEFMGIMNEIVCECSRRIWYQPECSDFLAAVLVDFRKAV